MSKENKVPDLKIGKSVFETILKNNLEYYAKHLKNRKHGHEVFMGGRNSRKSWLQRFMMSLTKDERPLP